jgi:hypothetical protein
MGRCRFFTRHRFSVFLSAFSKSVRFSVSVFLHTAVSVRLFGFFHFSLSIDATSSKECIHIWGRPTDLQTQQSKTIPFPGRIHLWNNPFPVVIENNPSNCENGNPWD